MSDREPVIMSRGPWAFSGLLGGGRIKIISEPWGEGHGQRQVASATVADAPIICMAPEMYEVLVSISKMTRQEVLESMQLKDRVDDLLSMITHIDRHLVRVSGSQ